MNEKLNNIFVTVNVAKLANEKGFDEWCACLYSNEIGIISNSKDCYEWDTSISEPSTVWLRIPTHFQLIKWLKDKHNIDVQMHHNGLWDVQNIDGEYVDLGLEINEALIIALNQIP